MIKRLVLLAIILSLSLVTPVAAAESDGVIIGQLINGTAGGGSVADLDITLETHLGEGEPTAVTGKTDAEGRFVFEGLNTDPAYGYHLKINYQQAEYDNGHIAFPEGETAMIEAFQVYDSTTSAEAISVATAHTVISVGQESLQVTEYFLFFNEDDRTYIGSTEVTAEGHKETLKLPLPLGATDLVVSQFMEYVVVGSADGIIDTVPVFPGYKEIAYSYQVGHDSSEFTLSRGVDYPTGSYEILVQGSGVTVSSEQMVTKEPLDMEGVVYEYLSATDLEPGDTLAIQLSGLPSDAGQQVIIWVVVGALLVLGLIFVYTMRQKKPQPAGTASPEREQQQLLADIARLDDDFEAGRITEESYRQQRAGKKGQLTKLMQGPRRRGEVETGSGGG